MQKQKPCRLEYAICRKFSELIIREELKSNHHRVATSRVLDSLPQDGSDKIPPKLVCKWNRFVMS